ncbi:MAG: hypothetical protein Q9197_002683 [Variospora fuerteventurae]
MARSRAAVARGATTKRKRAPPAIKAPRFSAQVATINEIVSTELPEEGGVSEGFETVELTEAQDVTEPTTPYETVEELASRPWHAGEAVTPSGGSFQGFQSGYILDEPHINPSHAQLEPAASESSELSDIDYEGDESCDEYKGADDVCSDDDYEEIDEQTNFTDDEIFIQNSFKGKIGVTTALLATARNYNSADDEEKRDATITGTKSRNGKADVPSLGPQPGGKKKRVSSKAMGQVRTMGDGDDATLEWFHPEAQEWIPAVYHEDVRAALIQAASELGQYQYPMAGGKYGELDVTAFHPLFKDNGPDREVWPEILLKYLPSKSDMMHFKPDYWYLHDGRVVVDLNDDAMYDYPEMPVTLARNADAWLLLTLMRMNNTVSLQDLRGRMFGGQNCARSDPLGRNRISMNMQRFRKFACCLTWNTIRAADTQREYLDKKLPRRCIRQNSTKSFRMLHNWEVAELDTKDAGKFLSRTRAKERDVSKAKSRAVYEQKAAVAQHLKKEFDKKHPYGLPNDYDTEDAEYHAQEASLAATPGWAMLEKESADANEFNVKKEPAVASTKHNKQKKQKRGSSRPSHKHLYVLSDEQMPSRARTAKCPGGHQNYAGFVTTAPNSVEDAQLLYDLLAPTRRHFQSCTLFEACRTEGDECYSCQHRQIQYELNDWHRQQPGLEEVPVCRLIRILYVDEQMLYWNGKWEYKWFGEPPSRELLARTQTDGELYW